MKRPRPAPDDGLGNQRSPKRPRSFSPDRLSILSDELLLRILFHLPITSLVRCQRVSYRFHRVAGDSQLWKAAYYDRFVRPRASRVPRIKLHGAASDSLAFSSKASIWLEDDELVRRGTHTDWKRHYKLRHNWARGSCDVSEVEIAEQPSVPPLLVRSSNDIIVTVDATAGLRAWDMKGQHRLLASVGLHSPDGLDGSMAPTSLGIDAQQKPGLDGLHAIVGFADGRFSVYTLETDPFAFDHRYTHPASSTGMITAVAFSSPYIVTMTQASLLTLYAFYASEADSNVPDYGDPRLLSSLKSHTVWPPLSLSIRTTSHNIVASIAYALPTYLSGWSVGLQELRLTHEGQVADSRLASAVTQGFVPLSPTMSPSSPSSPSHNTTSPYKSRPRAMTHNGVNPTSLSYNHPYLLASHADNTLTLYLVTSTAEELSISSGSRLWGHTSSVSGAQVSGRGKAVSVSMRGNELRVWELEGGFSSSASRRRLASGETSVEIRPERTPLEQRDAARPISEVVPRSGAGLVLDPEGPGASVARGWVGFNEENVVVLREKEQGSQALVFYDFS
ncbi:MAG: hypothetical protein M1833_002109 [Piccolia ochrophora]|nr:MAG: hypothetical protein M1833_002109 [Piccolia ochrophora]